MRNNLFPPQLLLTVCCAMRAETQPLYERLLEKVNVEGRLADNDMAMAILRERSRDDDTAVETRNGGRVHCVSGCVCYTESDTSAHSSGLVHL